MAIKFEKVQAGETLYDCHRTKMGNTNMTRMGTWTVDIVEINHAEGWAIVRWNGNPPTRWYRNRIVKLRRSPAKDQGSRKPWRT